MKDKTQIITVEITVINGEELTADTIQKKLNADLVQVKKNQKFIIE